MPLSFRNVLIAYRWPFAVILSTIVLSWTGFRLLNQPIPIAFKGGLQVDKLVLPPSVTIRSDTPLQVVVQEQVTIGGADPLAVEGAVSVTAEDPLAVRADVSIDNKVTIGGKVDIQGKVKPTLLPVPMP